MWYWADNSSPAKMRPDGWLGSNMFRGREIHDLRSLNRVLGDGGLVLAKRKPFNLLAERLFFTSRGDRTPIELFLASVAEWDCDGIRLVQAA